jgi:hypothetical protein
MTPSTAGSPSQETAEPARQQPLLAAPGLRGHAPPGRALTKRASTDQRPLAGAALLCTRRLQSP